LLRAQPEARKLASKRAIVAEDRREPGGPRRGCGARLAPDGRVRVAAQLALLEAVGATAAVADLPLPSGSAARTALERSRNSS
jgi:hypothetical protein